MLWTMLGVYPGAYLVRWGPNAQDHHCGIICMYCALFLHCVYRNVVCHFLLDLVSQLIKPYSTAHLCTGVEAVIWNSMGQTLSVPFCLLARGQTMRSVTYAVVMGL